MRVSVSENFKIWRWIGFPFFRFKKSSGGGDAPLLSRFLRAFFQFSKRAAGEATKFGRSGVKLLGVVRAAHLECGEPAAESGELIRRQLGTADCQLDPAVVVPLGRAADCQLDPAVVVPLGRAAAFPMGLTLGGVFLRDIKKGIWWAN